MHCLLLCIVISDVIQVHCQSCFSSDKIGATDGVDTLSDKHCTYCLVLLALGQAFCEGSYKLRIDVSQQRESQAKSQGPSKMNMKLLAKLRQKKEAYQR